MLADAVCQTPISLDSAASVLAECALRGIELQATPAGVRCRAPRGAMDSELQAAVAVHRDELRQLVQEATPAVAVDAPAPPPPTSDRNRIAVDWPADVGAASDFALLLDPDDLPAAPFAFGPGCTVVDATKFLAALRSDIRQGPRGPRARPGVLHAELLRLRGMVLDAHLPAIDNEAATSA